MHRNIDGAVIVSRNEKNLDCTVTFSAEYVSQRFLIRFDEFNMECGDRLYIYDSANAIGNHRVSYFFYSWHFWQIVSIFDRIIRIFWI